MAKSKGRDDEKDLKKKKGKAVEEDLDEDDDDDLDVEDLGLDEDDDDFDEDDEDEDEVPKKKAAPVKNKDTKKAGKKVEEPKKDKKSKKGETPKHMQVPDNMVTVKELEEEFGKTGKEIRTTLRDNDFEKPEGMGRWAWKKSDPDLKRLRSLLSGKKVKEAAPKAKEEAAPVKGKDKKKSKK